jgi:curli biogenesis system outer membrane secretion channel CsgG
MLHAFFIGRALAEAASDQAGQLMTNALSYAGKFDAEQRENLRQFTEDVLARAQQAEAQAAAQQGEPTVTSGVYAAQSQDLQATIDLLRAEIAQVRVALQQYRVS